MLRITEVTEIDAGDYRCTAKNHLGSVQHTIQVTVKSKMDGRLNHFTPHLLFSTFPPIDF